MTRLAEPAASAAATCANCGVHLAGEYCHSCGQRAIKGDELTVQHLLRVWADDILHLESKTLRSLGLVFRPGFLTSEYLAGRRAPYTSPVKVFLATAALFFLCAPFAGFRLEDLLAGDSSGELEKWVGAAIAQKGLDRRLFTERFDVRFQTVYTVLLSATMLGGAAMLALLYRRQRRPFGAHVVFELHYLSFLCFVSILAGLILQWLPSHPALSIAGLLVPLAPYLFFALRRVYGESTGRTLWKTAAMLVFAFFFDNLVNFVGLVVTLKLV